MTETAVRDLRRLVVLELRRYRDHEDYEDFIQEAWMSAWRQCERLQGQYAPATIVKVCSRGAVTSWVRSRRARRQWRPNGRVPVPESRFFSDLDATEEPWIEEAPRLVERISAHQVAVLALAAMTPRQAECIRESLMAGETYESAAIRLGTDRGTIHRAVQRGLKNARRALGGR